MTFKKDALNNYDKPMFDLIDPRFIEDMAKVLTIGAKKYGKGNYKKADKDQQNLYIGAIHRHLNAWQQGKKLDEETKLNHLISVSINAMFLYYFDLLEGVRK
jgi:hypothetical protein